MTSNHRNTGNQSHRREFIRQTWAAVLATAVASCGTPVFADIEGVATPSEPDPNPKVLTLEQDLQDVIRGTNIPTDKVTVFKSKSGIRYVDLVTGTGLSPRYGQFVTFSYKAYVKLPGPKERPQQYDESDAYLTKHGNGRMIPGLDEGLHTMRVGGKRRIVVPPKLGYAASDRPIGPIPVAPWNRFVLNRLLERMEDVRGGNFVFELEMLNVHDDEADQGYYEDDTPTPEEVAEGRARIIQSMQGPREGVGEA